MKNKYTYTKSYTAVLMIRKSQWPVWFPDKTLSYFHELNSIALEDTDPWSVCPFTLHISFITALYWSSVTGEEKASDTKEEVGYVESSTRDFLYLIFFVLLQQLSPLFVKESSHVVSGSSDFRIVLVVFLTVVKNQVDVNDEYL